MWRTCLELGWKPTRLAGWRVPDELVQEIQGGGDVVLYGEPLFAEAVADQLGLVLLEPAIDWLTTVPQEYLSREISLMSLGEARGMTSPAFVKPADGKIFEPKVYASGEELPTEEHVDASIPVLRSRILDFRLEVRCFVRSRDIVTLSPYWRNDDLAMDDSGAWSFRPGEEQGAGSFARRVLSDSRVELPPACTLDVGLDAGGEWVIIEANPCWGAGLYGCDPAAVLETIRMAVIHRRKVGSQHLKWISKRRTEIHGS